MHVLDETTKSGVVPVTNMSTMFRGPEPVLVTVTVTGVLGWPLKARLVALTDAPAVVPVPLTLTVCVDGDASSATVIVPTSGPADVGVNLMPIGQL